MNDEALRQKILGALANGPLTLIALCVKLAADSRHAMHILQALGSQKLVTFTRAEGWELTEAADVEASDDDHEAPTVQRIEAPEPSQPMAEARHNMIGVSMKDRCAHSVRTRVLDYVLALKRPERSGAIKDALGLPAAQVNNALWMLVSSKHIDSTGTRGSALYGRPGLSAAVTEVAEPEEVAPPPAPNKQKEPPQPAPVLETTPAAPKPCSSMHWISLRVAVPIDKARAVLAAIEQVLAA